VTKPITRLRKRAKQGDIGFPKATLAFYGPDNKRASKAVLGIFLCDDADAIIHRYFTDDTDARYTVDIQESILARIREHEDTSNSPLEDRTTPALRSGKRPQLARVWYWAAAAVVIVALGATLWWSGDSAVSERYATRHGEMRTWRLADQSTLRLNTDTAVHVRFTRAERFVEVERGEALFEVAHEPSRPFRVVSATANAEAVGTAFIVYRTTHETLVTVLEGRVAVSARDFRGSGVAVGAGQQARVSPGAPPTRATSVDVQRQTAWMRRQLIFEEQPLAAVAAEFNRYAPVPIEIASPALRALVISGTFSVDDVDTFVAFLRSLDGVRVDATSSRIRVEESPGARK